MYDRQKIKELRKKVKISKLCTAFLNIKKNRAINIIKKTIQNNRNYNGFVII